MNCRFSSIQKKANFPSQASQKDLDSEKFFVKKIKQESITEDQKTNISTSPVSLETKTQEQSLIDQPSLPQIELGLVCIVNELRTRKQKDGGSVFCSRNTKRENANAEKLQNLALQNCKDLLTILKWNESKGIRVFRISSELFPRYTDPQAEKYDVTECYKILKDVGKFCRKHGHRVLMHPDQFNQVASKSLEVFNNTCETLKMHADILDAIGLDEKESVMIIHGGGTFNDKKNTIKVWKERFRQLPENVQRRIALENDERQYNVKDILEMCEDLETPMIYDVFHDECHQKLKQIENNKKLTFETATFVPNESLFPRIIKTWKGHMPIMHISNQGSGRIGHHSDYISHFHPILQQFYTKFGCKISLEVEAKLKEEAIFELKDDILLQHLFTSKKL